MSDSGLHARDAAARLRALATDTSFIVRAPAGSGKTELLIQRVLALLATVNSPEEIVAITFTRKAAAEMSQRVVDALAAGGAGDASLPPHQQRTAELARAVVERDIERGWNIAANPSRLRIQTIDALAQSIARQLPLTLGLGASPNVTEDAEALYAEAARATMLVLDSNTPFDRTVARDIASVLEHLDNDVERFVELLASMLCRRDQWLRHLRGRERAELEAALSRACEEQMRRVCSLLPTAAGDELIALARYAAANLGPGSALSPCADLTALPAASLDRLDAWRALADLLLTKQGAWRSRIDSRGGFPTGANRFERERNQPYLERIHGLLAELRPLDGLRAALHGLRTLPPPRFSDAQWQIVQAIGSVLLRAAAELDVVFAQAGTMDFAEVTRRAVRALEAVRESDLAASLDARIRHVLVDEFQDTSITQYQLIERLVADWTVGDGRTLFVVGDPMQSIYRFREAEVGLFQHAWEQGLGPLRLEPLRLALNFRSQQAIVDWTNRAFARVLPREDDIASGAVSFEPAAAVRDAAGPAGVVVHALVDADASEEARRIVDVVRSIRAQDAAATIALLVRARSHLAAIAVALRDAGLRPTAVELDVLGARPHVADVLALTRAIEHRADRVAWLAVLRAPWCGLTLADLAALAEGEPLRMVNELLLDDSRIARMSGDGQARAVRVRAVLVRAEQLRARMPVAARAEQSWLLLGGPACCNDAERADVARYFEHLATHAGERRGEVDIPAFERSLAALYALPDAAADPNFHVMTIHKAKGLEFDHVIVPGLARAIPRDDPQLMIWLERAAADGAELLVAPIHAGGYDKDPLVRWVESQSQQLQQREDERLGYVAATRARSHLHLLACVARDAQGRLVVPDASLLARLWPALAEDFERAAPASSGPSGFSADLPDQTLRRLPAGWTMPALPAAIPWAAGETTREVAPAIEFSWAGETARRVGVVVHRWLQRIAEDGVARWSPARVASIAPQIERSLAAGGLTGDELLAARTRVAQALVNVIEDERGRWILTAHPQHRSELRVTVDEGTRVRRFVLDRSFVTADGTRWIVDYKVGVHEGADVEKFLDEEQERYRAQLESYGAALDPTARLGLYFPLVTGWRHWTRTPESDITEERTDIIPDGGPPRTEVP